jgi:hypothetical protein
MHATHCVSRRTLGLFLVCSTLLCTAFGPDERRTVGNLSYTWSPEPCPAAASVPYQKRCLPESTSTDLNASNVCAETCHSVYDYCVRAEYGKVTASSTWCPTGAFECVIFEVLEAAANGTHLRDLPETNADAEWQCISNIVEGP